jgi:putative acetyltransferase
VELRAYAAGDAEATLDVFLRAVRETGRAHYSVEQIEDWAADHGDLDSWAAARAAADTYLATIGDRVAGFIDVDDSGYIDMLFVHPDFGRRGVASALLAHVIALSRARGLPESTTFASLTSRPVFERLGFVATGQRYFGEGDRAAKTYAMRCALDDNTAP